MKVLMLDVGGTNVKIMATGHEEFRKFPSGPRLTPSKMVQKVLRYTKDWDFEVVSLGFPGLVMDAKPKRNPLNLGGQWVGFDYEAAFQRPVRIINDASMQALASYEQGRMLFIGLGTSIGATLIADDVIVPLEVGMLRLSKSASFEDCLRDATLRKEGKKRWEKNVWQATELLQDCFWPDQIVIGGGNAKVLELLPEGVRIGNNQDAFRGAVRLWPGADMLAKPKTTLWQITRRKKTKPSS